MQIFVNIPQQKISPKKSRSSLHRSLVGLIVHFMLHAYPSGGRDKTSSSSISIPPSTQKITPPLPSIIIIIRVRAKKDKQSTNKSL